MTEDETIILLMKYLENEGWNVDAHCLGQTRGCDIEASKAGTRIYIEVKGARAGDDAPTKRRQHFDSGQIKTHFGKAIIKVLEDKNKYPGSEFAIAHPDDKDIRKAIGNLIPYLNNIGVKHFWVSSNGQVVIN